VKLLNDLFDFEEKLTVDEVEDQIRETENNDFIEGKAVHLFNEITAILDFMPAGYGDEDEDTPATGKRAKKEDSEDDDLPEIEEEEDERMKNDASLKWDDEDEVGKDGEEKKEGDKDKDEDDEDKDEDDEDEDEDEDDEDSEEDDEKPSRSKKSRK